MKRALAIRTYGDSEIGNVLANALASNVPSNDELETVKAELEEAKQREAELGVRKVRDADYFRCLAAEAEFYYGRNPHYGRIRGTILGVIGLVCEVVDGCFKYMQAWNRES